MYICTHVIMYICTYAYMYICMNICVCICVCVYVYVYAYAYAPLFARRIPRNLFFLTLPLVCQGSHGWSTCAPLRKDLATKLSAGKVLSRVALAGQPAAGAPLVSGACLPTEWTSQLSPWRARFEGCPGWSGRSSSLVSLGTSWPSHSSLPASGSTSPPKSC